MYTACVLVFRYSRSLGYLCKLLPWRQSVLGETEHKGTDRLLITPTGEESRPRPRVHCREERGALKRRRECERRSWYSSTGNSLKYPDAIKKKKPGGLPSMGLHRVGHDWSDLEKKKKKPLEKGFPGSSVVKNLPVNAGDVGSIPGSGRSPGEGNDNPL